MSKELIEKKAAYMKDRKWILEGKINTVTDYRVTNTDVYLNTHLGNQVYSHEEFLAARERAEELEGPSRPPAGSGTQVYSGTVHKSDTLRSLNAENFNIVQELKDNITKLKTDKTYIGQARAVNETVKTILEIAKTEISLLKIQKA